MTLENIGPRKVQKTAKTVIRSLKRVPGDIRASRSNVDAQKPSSFECIRSMVKNTVDNGNSQRRVAILHGTGKAKHGGYHEH